MFAAARFLFRKAFPRRRHPLLDATPPSLPEDGRLDTEYQRVIALTPDANDAFVAHRFREGLRWRHVVESFLPSGHVRILDLGAGNGAIELALAANPRFSTVSVEELWNPVAREIHTRAGVPFRRVRGDGRRLPFRDGSFGAVVCLETIEHVRDPHLAGAEVSRVVGDGGVILLTTPPRLRYAFLPDPHFGLRGLVLWPAATQRRIAARNGFGAAHHYVDRIYTSVRQVAALFPECEVLDVLSRSRAPRRWFWDAILLQRRHRPSIRGQGSP